MRRKDKWKQIMALTLAAAMTLGLAGCGNDGSGSKESGSAQQSEQSSEESKAEESSEEQESTPEVENSNSVGWAADLGDQEWTGDQATLTLISPYSGVMASSTSWWEDEIRKYTGVTFEREDGVKEKYSAVLSSGDFKDLMGFDSVDDVVAAAEAGKLINLEDYKDQLPNLFQNPLMDSAIKFWKEQRLAGLDGLYIAPMEVGNNDSTTEIPMIRYDLYEKVGSPKPANMEEYFQMLKEMNDINKTAEDGDPCYVMVGWNSGDLAFGGNMVGYYGWFGANGLLTVVAKGDGSEVANIFDEQVPFKKMLKAYNDLWLNGYVHPDSVSMDYGTAKPIFDNGHGLFIFVEWMGGKYNDIHTDETGNMTVWAEDFEVYINADAPVGSTRVIGISSDCKDLDAALRFLNWYFSPTAYNIVKNGPEGYLWEYTDDGKQTFTADGIERYRTNREEIGSGGDLFTAQQFLNAQPYTTYVLNPTTGQPLYHEYWDAFYETEKRWGQLEWRRQTGFTRTVDMAFAKGAKTKSTAFSLLPGLDPDLEPLKGALNNAYKTYSWKLVEAKDDAEFEKLWAEFQKECEDLGQAQIYDWFKSNFEAAQTLAEQYPLKTSWD